MANEQAQGAMGGAAQGASAGAAFGPWGAAIGGIAGGIGGALMSKRKPKAPDIGPILAANEASAARQNQIMSGLRPQLAPMSDKYGADIKGLATGLQDQTKTMADKYIVDQSNASTALNRNLSDELKQRVMQTQPELAKQLREGLAASGQLRSGAAAAAQGNLANTLANQIGQGQQQIATQDLQARQEAMRTALGMNEQALVNATGMNKDAMTALFNSGREDLINEAMQLIAIEQNRGNNQTSIMQGGQMRDLAQQSADAANRTQLGSTIGGGIGQLLGTYMQSRGQSAPTKVA